MSGLYGRPTIRLKKQPAGRFVNWRVGGSRPTRQHATATAARIEAKRLAAKHPGATFHTFELRLIGTNGED